MNTALRTVARRVVLALPPLGRLVDRIRARRLIVERRRADEERQEAFRAANQAEIERSGDQFGSPGWLIRTESTYSPRRDRYRATNSPLSPKRRIVNSGGDKMSFDRNAYAPAYARIMQRWVGQAPLLVELGAFRGSGLAVWCDLFPEGRVIGLDVSLQHFNQNVDNLRSRGAFSAYVPQVLQFDAYEPDADAVRRALDGRTIDVFIDDGPHKEAPSCLVAERLRPLLSHPFTYVIEDVDGIYDCLRRIFPDSDIQQVARGLVVITEGQAGGPLSGPSA